MGEALHRMRKRALDGSPLGGSTMELIRRRHRESLSLGGPLMKPPMRFSFEPDQLCGTMKRQM
jgi:hypothetical protein